MGHRFGIPVSMASSISRLLKDTISNKLVKPLYPSAAPKLMQYVPIWALYPFYPTDIHSLSRLSPIWRVIKIIVFELSGNPVQELKTWLAIVARAAV